MSFTRTLVATLAVALAVGSATLLTTSCRTQPAAQGALAAKARPERAAASRARDVEQLRTLRQLQPTIDLFVRGLNRGDATEISAAFLEVGTLEPGKGKPVRGRGAIRTYYARRGAAAAEPVAARIDAAVIGSDRASVDATLVPRAPAQRPPAHQPCREAAEPMRATFVLRRSAPTDWHIERLAFSPR